MPSLCKRLGFTHCETRTLAHPLLPSFRLLCEGRIELSCPGGRVGPKKKKTRDALKGAGGSCSPPHGCVETLACASATALCAAGKDWSRRW
jgi:hypothetical protein